MCCTWEWVTISTAQKQFLIGMERIYSLNCRGKLLDLGVPKVMGILNLTPDSFSDGGRYNNMSSAIKRVEEMMEEGADIIDIGGYSSRPYSEDISVEDELSRIEDITIEILRNYPDAVVSIDTFRSKVAKRMLDVGVHMINDISAGGIDPEILDVVGKEKVPYVMMHMKGTPQTMQMDPHYDALIDEILEFLCQRIFKAIETGIQDIVIDPGFGFGKTIQHNYRLLAGLNSFTYLHRPILVGISRKSMIYKLLDTSADDVVEISTALHLQALLRGANILRVHDVKAAKRIVNICEYMKKNGTV